MPPWSDATSGLLWRRSKEQDAGDCLLGMVRMRGIQRAARALAVVAALPAGASAVAQALPPQQPQLIIDPGMHTAPIRRIAADAACSLLATAAEDKTVRLWRLPQGKLLNTLRPPIGPGNEGKIYAVAMAPDGGWVAAGGWDAQWAGSHQHYVYVFQTVTGAMMARLGPLANVIYHLAVSPDGRFLAAAVWGGNGLKVWERMGAGASNWRLAAEDEDYGGKDFYGATFDRNGILYTVAFDGKLRRYPAGYVGKPLAMPVRGGKRPFSVAVNPAADRVAVAYDDSVEVDVYDASTLAWRFAAYTKDVDNGMLAHVAWSADGSRLYAGNQYTRGGMRPIRFWSNGGEGPARELPGPRNAIVDLAPCGDGIVLGAADPSFGLLAADGSRRLWQENVQADLRDLYERFTASADGMRVRFALRERGEVPVLFDLAAERLIDAPAAVQGLNSGDTKSLPVTDWSNRVDPKLAGVPLKLRELELARSLAIAPDKRRFILGADWGLRAYDSAGKLLWEKAVPGVVWDLNIATEAGLIIAAYGDGTIRWHRLDDGRELLALFVQAKDRRWVVWTPKGYYAASAGGESLVGWHVNRGWNETADFFSVDRFRGAFNRPDIVRLMLGVQDEDAAVAEANRRASLRRAPDTVRTSLPPVIEIISPQNDSMFRERQVTLEYMARSPTGRRITDIDVYVNGAALAARSPMPVAARGEAPVGLMLTLPPEDVTVTVVAREGDRASQPASVRLRWDGVKPGETLRPRMRGLFVGISDYKLPELKLAFAAKDATDLAAFFKSQEGKAFSKAEIRLLANADRVAVLAGLEWLEKGSEEDDVNVLFLAGHGVTDETGYFYFVPADGIANGLRATAIGRDELLRTIRNRKGAMVVMLDTCQSGASADASVPMASPVDMNRLANELGDKTLGVFLYASALGRQFSYESHEWGNGAFTKAIIEGLSGRADRDNTGFVDTDELALYVRRRVMDMTKQMQEPVRIKPDAAAEMRIAKLR
jgi:WD40 repeat protein